MTGAIVLFTHESDAQIREQGGSGDWTVNADRIRKYPYVVLVRNRAHPQAPDDVEHRTAFLVGRISGARLTGKASPNGRPRYFVNIQDCAPIRKPNIRPKSQNPVWYTDLETLGVDESELEFSSTSQGPAVSAETKQPDLGAIRQQLARAFGVPPTSIEITIRL